MLISQDMLDTVKKSLETAEIRLPDCKSILGITQLDYSSKAKWKIPNTYWAIQPREPDVIGHYAGRGDAETEKFIAEYLSVPVPSELLQVKGEGTVSSRLLWLTVSSLSNFVLAHSNFVNSFSYALDKLFRLEKNDAFVQMISSWLKSNEISAYNADAFDRACIIAGRDSRYSVDIKYCAWLNHLKDLKSNEIKAFLTWVLEPYVLYAEEIYHNTDDIAEYVVHNFFDVPSIAWLCNIRASDFNRRQEIWACFIQTFWAINYISTLDESADEFSSIPCCPCEDVRALTYRVLLAPCTYEFRYPFIRAIGTSYFRDKKLSLDICNISSAIVCPYVVSLCFSDLDLSEDTLIRLLILHSVTGRHLIKTSGITREQNVVLYAHSFGLDCPGIDKYEPMSPELIDLCDDYWWQHIACDWGHFYAGDETQHPCIPARRALLFNPMSGTMVYCNDVVQFAEIECKITDILTKISSGTVVDEPVKIDGRINPVKPNGIPFLRSSGELTYRDMRLIIGENADYSDLGACISDEIEDGFMPEDDSYPDEANNSVEENDAMRDTEVLTADIEDDEANLEVDEEDFSNSVANEGYYGDFDLDDEDDSCVLEDTSDSLDICWDFDEDEEGSDEVTVIENSVDERSDDITDVWSADEPQSSPNVNDSDDTLCSSKCSSRSDVSHSSINRGTTVSRCCKCSVDSVIAYISSAVQDCSPYFSFDDYIHLLSLALTKSELGRVSAWLKKHRFADKPGSFRHSRWNGGLVDHSIFVLYHMLKDEDVTAHFSAKTIIKVALLHDWCKIDAYSVSDSGEFVANPDILPMGHGEKSVYLACCFTKLSPVEALAIRWHVPPGYYNEDYEKARQSRLLLGLQLADKRAALLDGFAVNDEDWGDLL